MMSQKLHDATLQKDTIHYNIDCREVLATDSYQICKYPCSGLVSGDQN